MSKGDGFRNYTLENESETLGSLKVPNADTCCGNDSLLFEKIGGRRQVETFSKVKVSRVYFLARKQVQSLAFNIQNSVYM